MKFLLDTSTLLAALLPRHSAHGRAYPWLYRATWPGENGLVASHSLAEVYVNLTRLPGQPPLEPLQAQQVIDRDIIPHCTIIELTSQDYQTVLKHLSNLRIGGAAVYDALIVYAGIKGDAEQIITLNPRHFQRVYPGYSNRIVAP